MAGTQKNSSALPDLPSLSLSLGAREGKICVCGYVMTTSIFLVTPSFRKQSMETISKGKKICDNHLFSGRFAECSSPRNLQGSAFSPPGSCSKVTPPRPHGRTSLPPLVVYRLSTHVPHWNVSPRSTKPLVYCVLHLYPSAEDTQEALKNYLLNT